MERNKKHFHQAFDAPFGGGVNDGALAGLVGHLGLTEADANDAIEGSFLERHGGKVDLLPMTRRLIIEMVAPDEIKIIKKTLREVTTDELIEGFKRRKEPAPAPPSGRRLGRCKAATNNNEKRLRDELR